MKKISTNNSVTRLVPTQVVPRNCNETSPSPQVTAVNFRGTSNVTPVEVTGWSGEDTPRQAPANFTLEQVTSGTTALLNWAPVPPDSVQGHFKG